uniref:Myosin motor domain-containing protein n=1 Tax=Timema poppense TaxID=170557 RepID=A0A7R9DKT6_TIMPO|nr:unnamed protein product [Timema poppensis]
MLRHSPLPGTSRSIELRSVHNYQYTRVTRVCLKTSPSNQSMSQDLPEYPEYVSRPTRVTRVCLKTSPSNQNGKSGVIQNRYRNHTPNENLISFPLKHSNSICSPTRASYTYQAQRSNNETHNSNNRLSWPIFPSHNEENTSSRQQRTSEQPISEDNEIKTVERARRDSQKSQAGALERVLCPNDARVMERANQIVIRWEHNDMVVKRGTPGLKMYLTLSRKNKSFRPRERGKKGLKNLQSVKTLAGRTQSNQQLSGVGGKARKQPLTVTAQFQQSLQSLMDTLNQANPFFIRCIKSNGNKATPLLFLSSSPVPQLLSCSVARLLFRSSSPVPQLLSCSVARLLFRSSSLVP